MPFLRKDAGPRVRLEEILERLEETHPDSSLEPVRRAYVYAARAHRGQTRRSGEPYLSHTLAVAMIIAEMGLCPVSVAVGLLHDVIEDTETTFEMIEAAFGAEVTKLVEGVTKIGKMRFTSRVEAQAGNFRKLLIAMVDDIRVLLVKFADRLHNMRTLGYLDESARHRIARETLDIYAPLAHRLGMGRMQRDLEDLSLRHLEPEEFQDLQRLVLRRIRAVHDLTDAIEDQIRGALTEHGIKADVQHRVKGLQSLRRKMQNRDLAIDEVFDLVAFRIIMGSVRDCYAALGIIHNLWNPIPGRFKDYIAMPKPNMYQSLHTSLMHGGQPFEVQIRTGEMDRIAEEGIAAHWMYKEGVSGSVADTEPYRWLRRLVEQQPDEADPREFLSSLKVDLYPDEVYVFTRDGEVVSLPRGATPIDFAYSIHTEVGHHCTGAKVNGKLVPLRQQLRNGDRVEITTSPDATPSRDWLQVVMTPRAKAKIRGFINRHDRERSVELGTRLAEKEFRKRGLRIKKLLASGAVETLASQLGLARADDLFAAIGFGKVSARFVAEKLMPAAPEEEAAEPGVAGILRGAIEKAIGRGVEAPIRVKGLDDILAYRASCCGPVPGEPILGYITRGKGVSVHAADCPNAEHLKTHEERCIEVEWEGPGGDVQPVSLTLDIEDRQGLLAAVTTRIADTNTNIRNIESHIDRYGRGTIEIVLDVTDVRHLGKIRRNLETVKGVRSIRRGRGH